MQLLPNKVCVFSRILHVSHTRHIMNGCTGWKIILLLRLSPVLPDSVLNYVLAATSISYVSYAISSSVAILPWTIVYAYLGSVATDVSAAASGNGGVHWGWLTALTILSLILLVVFGYFVTRAVKRTLTEVLDDKSKSVA